MSLKKEIIIKVYDDEIVVPIDFNVIEKVERVYGCSAEIAAAIHLSDPMRIQRRQISAVIALWVQGRTKIQPSAVTEAVMTCSQKQLARYTGSIQAGVLYSIRGEDGRPLITSEQFDLLVNGEDLPAQEEQEVPEPKKEKKPVKPRAATSKKRTA